MRPEVDGNGRSADRVGRAARRLELDGGNVVVHAQTEIGQPGIGPAHDQVAGACRIRQLDPDIDQPFRAIQVLRVRDRHRGARHPHASLDQGAPGVGRTRDMPAAPPIRLQQRRVQFLPIRPAVVVRVGRQRIRPVLADFKAVDQRVAVGIPVPILDAIGRIERVRIERIGGEIELPEVVQSVAVGIAQGIHAVGAAEVELLPPVRDSVGI